MVVNIVDVGWATSKSGCLPIPASDHRDFGSSFELEFSSHAADILGADDDGGVEGGCGQGGGGVGGRWWRGVG